MNARDAVLWFLSAFLGAALIFLAVTVAFSVRARAGSVTWPTTDVNGNPIPTTSGAGGCTTNAMTLCWFSEIIDGQSGNTISDTTPLPGEQHTFTPCWRAGTGFTLAACFNACGEGDSVSLPVACANTGVPSGPPASWP